MRETRGKVDREALGASQRAGRQGAFAARDRRLELAAAAVSEACSRSACGILAKVRPPRNW